MGEQGTEQTKPGLRLLRGEAHNEPDRYETITAKVFFLTVPDGASAQQVERMQEAVDNIEVRSGIHWLVKHGLTDTPVGEDFLTHLSKDVLAAHGVEPKFCMGLLKNCVVQHRREEELRHANEA